MVKIATLLCFVVAAYGFHHFHREFIARFNEVEGYAAPVCAKYQCSSQTFDVGTCEVYSSESNTFSLGPCNEDEYCRAFLGSTDKGTCLPKPPPPHYKYPGVPCDSDKDCTYRDKCNEQGICQGGRQNAPCTIESTCDVGYNCMRKNRKSYCVKQIPLGQPCGGYLDDELCVNSAVCGLDTCVPWFSQPTGTIVKTDYAAIACETGYYQTVAGVIDKVVCAEPPKSHYWTTPKPCTPGSYCVSSAGEVAKPCQCGLNPSASAYCPLFPGDAVYQNFVHWLKQYSLVLDNCHFAAIGKLQCGASDEVWREVNKAKLEVEYFTSKEGNDACTKEVYTYAYWGSGYFN